MPMYRVLDKKVQDNPLLGMHLFGMRIFGLYIFGSQSVPFLHWFRGLFFSITFTIFNVTQHVDLISLWGNVDEMTTNAATTLLFTTTVFRLVNFFRNRETYTNIVARLDDMLSQLMDTEVPEERDIIEKNLKYTRTLTLGFWTIALTTGNLMCVQSFILSFLYEPHDVYDPVTVRKFFIFLAIKFVLKIKHISFQNTTQTSFPPVILRSWFPFDDQWEHFYTVYFVQFYNMWVGMIIVPCWHSFMVALMVFAILRLQILNHQFQHVEVYVLGGMYNAKRSNVEE
uniref:Uncharacterized protein n=1 Tax=Phlebotomus papatasi TaxID=29031 RepID=A0A1B0DIE1_PHLPP